MIRAFSPLRHLAAVLIVLAFAVRVVIPSGFMPSTERGFALTICAGMDTQTVWMDSKGKLHKEDPSKGKAVEHQPCSFAGAAVAHNAPPTPLSNALPHIASITPVFFESEVSVGTGLAAPPPPAIGPPSFI